MSRRALGALTAVTACFLLVGVGDAAATDVVHGIGFTKACASPTTVGDPYMCSFTVRNVIDEAQDTLTISGLADVVHAASGDQSSGNILGSAQVTTGGGATCTALSGTGTAGNPYTSVSSCTLPFGGQVNVLSISHYTVQPADFDLPQHQLKDDASLTWHDLCDDPAASGNSNCNANPVDATASSLTVVQRLASSTATQIHDGAHQQVTVVEAGTSVHDFVTVTGQSGKPNPTGNLTLEWFTNGTCAGSAAASAPVGPLAAGGQFDAVGSPQTPNAGFFAFRATYLGDATYTGSSGSCEALQAVDAGIQLAPATATNQIGTSRTLTCHVNVNDGTGAASAPAGVICTGSIESGPGSFVGSNQCTTVGTTGSCSLSITSSVTGSTIVRGSTDVVVGGVTLHRATGDTHAGDSADATTTWTATAPTAFSLTVSTTGAGSGSVASNPAGIDCGADCTETFAKGVQVTLTATPASGSTFISWSGPCTGTSLQCSFKMDRDRSAAARFEKVPVNTVLPKITGDAMDGSRLEVSLGTWTDASSYAITWLRCGASSCTSVGTGAKYTPGAADLGFRMQARVTASNAYASRSALAAMTQPVQAAPPLAVDLPVISGTFALGSTMSASAGTWHGTGPITYAYQWLRCGTTGACGGISGATNATYVVQQADIGQKLRVRVTAQASMGSASAVSRTVPATSSPTPPRNTALGGVSGNAAVGQTLHAGPGTWSGTATITFTYQWRRCTNASASSCSAIAGATARDYVATASDRGMRLRVVVSASNGVTSTRMTTRASGVIG